jgi:hypothetical protein
MSISRKYPKTCRIEVQVTNRYFVFTNHQLKFRGGEPDAGSVDFMVNIGHAFARSPKARDFEEFGAS